MKLDSKNVAAYAIALAAAATAFSPNSVGIILAMLPGFMFSYFFLDCRKTVRVLLSVPLTMVLVLVPTWILSVLSIPINGIALIFLSLVYTITFAFLLKGKINLDVKLGSEAVLVFVLVAATIFITYPLHSGLLPRTDGSSHYYKSWELRQSLDNQNSITLWDHGWYAGYALFDFYPPMSYYFNVFLSYLTPSSLNVTFDYVIILSYLMLAIGVFILSRELGLNKFSSFVAGLIVISSPRLATNTMFSGQFPTILAFSLVPISVYVFIRAFSEGKAKLYTLSGVLLGVNFLTHHLTGYFLATLLVLVFLVFSAKKKNLDMTGFAKIILTSVLLIAFWIIPFFVNIGFSEYSKKSVIGFNPDVFLVLTTSPTKACNDYYCFESMGMEFTILAVLGVIVWLGGFSVSRGKLSILPKIRLGSAIAVSMLAGVLLLALAPFLGITNYIPFGSSFGAERFTFYLILPIAILGGSILELLNGFGGKDMLLGGFLFSGLMFAFLWNYIDLVNFRAADWNTEAAPLNSSGLSDVYDVLRVIPDGRVMTYGIFQGAIVGAIPVQTGKGVISGWQPQSSPNYKNVAGKLEDISGQSLFNFDISNKFVYTIFKQSWTRWIVINLCSPEGATAVNSTFSRDGRYLYAWRNGNGQGCLVLLEVPDTAFAETIEPVGVVNDDQNIRESIYDTENGSFVHFTKNLGAIPANEYRIVINRDIVWDKNLAEDIANIAAAEFKPLESKIGFNEITVKAATGWTLIKETYYPLWSAYNGKDKLKIYETDLGFMLVKSEGDITLKLEKPVYYLMPAVVTVLYFLFILLSTISEKPPSHNPDKEPNPVL
ncbi:MAG: glycosyltransferase family 39 protein [Candidatus Aenigmarchaeota archaeon]|nr:glycosyltransferase family 39 protein [Candidatus Aenigmarchaeota archaeon]